MAEVGGARSAPLGRLDVIRDLTPFERDGIEVVHVGGYASVTDTPYEMYDFFGPYTEIVTAGAFTQTLARSDLEVEFCLNHGRAGGASMACISNGTLELASERGGARGEDSTGLPFHAYVDPRRSDVRDMLLALERRDLKGASFRFRIDSGRWSDDYQTYYINAVDLMNGDVSSVNFGASPHAWSELEATFETPTRAAAEPTRAVERAFDPYAIERI